jgi:hypothetical protein
MSLTPSRVYSVSVPVGWPSYPAVHADSTTASVNTARQPPRKP